jgi:hypothetical protein
MWKWEHEKKYENYILAFETSPVTVLGKLPYLINKIRFNNLSVTLSATTVVKCCYLIPLLLLGYKTGRQVQRDGEENQVQEPEWRHKKILIVRCKVKHEIVSGGTVPLTPKLHNRWTWTIRSKSQDK